MFEAARRCRRRGGFIGGRRRGDGVSSSAVSTAIAINDDEGQYLVADQLAGVRGVALAVLPKLLLSFQAQTAETCGGGGGGRGAGPLAGWHIKCLRATVSGVCPIAFSAISRLRGLARLSLDGWPTNRAASAHSEYFGKHPAVGVERIVTVILDDNRC